MTSLPFGHILDSRRLELAPGAYYHWYSIRLDRGLQKVHTVEFHPSNPILRLQAGTKAGKVYGMQGVTQMARYADREGNRVIAGVNGDFYDLSEYGTGFPGGLFISDGKILNSPAGDYDVFALNRDGTTKYGPSPRLIRTVTIRGVTRDLTHINRSRREGDLLLYTPDFADSTKTTDLGDEVLLDLLEGEVKSGRTLRMRVAEIRRNQGNTPLAEAGRFVLSAQGSARWMLEGLLPGEEVSAYFQLEDGWQQAWVALSGRLLMKDGNVLERVPPAGIHPRTAIGTKADGTVVLLEIDGRAPGFSEGVETEELGQIMRGLGVVDALNLDGGGSSTFIARLPGEPSFRMLNRGSDGRERPTGNSLLLVNRAPSGPAARLVITPGFERVLAGSTLQLTVRAVDAAGHPAALAETPVWSVDPEFGTVEAGGLFTAGHREGIAAVAVSAGGLSGAAGIEIVGALSELTFPEAEKAVDSRSVQMLTVQAFRNGQEIRADNRLLEWSVEGGIGTISPDGVFTAADVNEKTGRIAVRFGKAEAFMAVTVGAPPVTLENFENGLERYLPSAGANFNTASAGIAEEEEFVRFGTRALKLEYDFTGRPGTSGVYLQPRDEGDGLAVPGYPQKIGMWVYGDGSGNWLRARLRDKNGTGGALQLDFTKEEEGINWKGWRHVEASVPSGLTPPLRLDVPVRLMATSRSPGPKGSGAIYVDEIRALYGPSRDDLDPPVVTGIEPPEGAVIRSNMPAIRALARDAGHDPAVHPGTTRIDPEKIYLYLDDVLVPHTLYPPEGRIGHKPLLPLADGLHKVRLHVRDLSGNRTEKEWTFTVDTGAPRFEYETPREVYAGEEYSLEIRAVNGSGLRAGRIGLAFDPDRTERLRWEPAGRLTARQAEAEIDPEQGTVLLKFAGLDQASLSGGETLGRIRYRVRPDAEGTCLVTLRSGLISAAGPAAANRPFFKLPQESAILHRLRLHWNESGTVEGGETRLTVEDESGAPVPGATVLADGAEIGVTDERGRLTTRKLTQTVRTCRLQAFRGTAFSPVLSFAVSGRAGAVIPGNISVTMGENPAVSRGFAWHTHPDVTETVVEAAEKAGFAGFDGPGVLRFRGASSLFTARGSGTVRVHKAEAGGLKPDTEYVYRVGDGRGHCSGQGTFKTAPLGGDRVKFLFFGDSQAGDREGFSLWGAALRRALEEHPDADFLVHGGDLVDNGFKESEWNLWFEAAQPQLMRSTLVAVIGNHEVAGSGGSGEFLAHFHQPGSGLSDLAGTCFSFDYGPAHFTVLNSEFGIPEQREWLRRDLAATGQRWKIAFFHRGPYGSIYDSEAVRTGWVPVFDEFGVDLVLSGHDHVYLRSMLRNHAKAEPGCGTVYVTAGSTGPKFYGLRQREWTQLADAEPTQMVVAVEIRDDRLTLLAKTVGGRLVDRLTFGKGR